MANVASDRRARVFPSLLTALIFPFTVLLFGPFEIFASNYDEFTFLLKDFLPLCAVFFLALTAIFFSLLFFVREKAYRRTRRVLLILSLLFFLQGNYFNLGLSSLEGDGGFSAYTVGQKIGNGALWLALAVGLWFLFRFLEKKNLADTVYGILCITLLGMQLVSTVALSITTERLYSTERPLVTGTTDAAADTERSLLSVENLTSVSKDGNAVIFLVDRFDRDFALEAMEDDPDLFSSLDGFTFYDDAMSLYARTYPALTYLLTEEKMDYFDPDRLPYFDRAYRKAPQLRALHDAGYTVNIYTENVYGYDDAAAMADYAENLCRVERYTVTKPFQLSYSMIGMSVYRYLPLAAKTLLGGLSTKEASQAVGYETDAPVYSIDMKDVYDRMTAEDFTLRDGKNFALIHVQGCHAPYYYDEEFETVSGAERRRETANGLANAFAIIDRYLSEMKRLGVYDDATVIITGDHGDVHNDFATPDEERLTALFVKPAGSSGTPLATSDAPVCHGNLWATVAESEGVTLPSENPLSVFDIEREGNYDAVRRSYLFHRLGAGFFEVQEYTVTGDGRDFSHWELQEPSRRVSGSEYR